MPHKILSSDWSDYDNRKKKVADARDFSCTETWERDYLSNKIHRIYPQHSEAAIKGAIDACCLQVGAPHPRPAFVECVMKRLRS